MKKLILLFIGLVVLFSCNNPAKQKQDSTQVLTVEQLQEKGKDLVGQEVVVKGTVNHVCKQSGARCFIIGSTEDASIRIEAGKIGSFTQEQMGSEIQVRGLLMEVQVDEEDLAEMQDAAAKGEDANADHALGHNEGDLHNVDGGKHDSINRAKKLEEMSTKLAESGEGYVPVYYLEGLELILPPK
jgi:hypothetical protein